MEGLECPPAPACDLSSLEPDVFAAVCEHLQHHEVAVLASCCSSMHHAVASNDHLWSSLYSSQFPKHWQRLTQPPPPQLQQQQQQCRAGDIAPGGWRNAFLRSHTTCQQLRSTNPACRQWTTDSTPVHRASLHGSGVQRLTLAAQGSIIELRCAPSGHTSVADRSIQCYGHSARVSAAAVMELGAAERRVGIATASHDQTVRLWATTADSESYDSRSMPLTLLTPLRTLRGHHEAVTSLQLVAGSTGVTIAATGSKDRTVRLWGLAPLLLSPVQKPQIATLRGHGAPVTCLAMDDGSSRAWDGSGWDDSSGSAGSSNGAATQLLSGSLDSRVKSWDPWTAACTGTAKCTAPVTAMQAVAANPTLQPHALIISGGSGLQLLDLRSMRGVAAVALPPERSLQVHCFAQHGWDLAVGSSDGARVFDLRMLSAPDAGSGTAPSSSGGGGRSLPERLRLTGHARPITTLHVDRLKVVTATDRYGEAPVRVWCTVSGDCLAELDSCLPPVAPASSSSAEPGDESDGGEQQGAAEAEQQGAAAAAAAGAEQQDGGGGAAATSPQLLRHQYQRGWEGVTALACRGALMVTGNSNGTLCERNFSRGGLPEPEQGGGEAGWTSLVGKFWQYNAA